MLKKMLTPQVKEECYGYGIWLDKKDNGTFSYHFEGCDPGVSFFSSYDRERDLQITLVRVILAAMYGRFLKISQMLNRILGRRLY